MKKFFKLFLVLLLVITPLVGVDAKSTKKKTTTAKKDPINFYIFYGETCGFCASLHEYTKELEKDKDVNYMFKIVDYEVWNSSQNNNLMINVGKYFNFNVTGVPFYVIGEKYFTGFSQENSPSQIVDAIKEAYNDKDYKDIVSGIGEGKIAVPDSNTDEKDENLGNDIVGYIILGVTAVVIIAIIFGRSSNKYDDEDDKKKEEENNDTKTKKKTTNKSTATKKNTKK